MSAVIQKGVGCSGSDRGGQQPHLKICLMRMMVCLLLQLQDRLVLMWGYNVADLKRPYSHRNL